MVAVVDKQQAFYVGIYPPTGDYEFLDNQPAVDGVTLTKNTTKADLDLDEVFQYRGQVATYSKLPKSGLHRGDTYNVADTGENYAWNGSSWDLLTGFEAVYFKDNTLKSQDAAITINADNNTISNLETDNLKTGVLQTSVRDVNTATDTNLASEKAIRTELNKKQNTVTGAATTITSSNLTKNRAVISNNSGKIAVSTVTSTELGYLSGVTSAIQTQINNEITNRTTADDSKIDKFSTMPEVSKDYANKIVQYVGETNASYTNGYFYKCAETGTIPDSITFTPKEGVPTIVEITPANFVAFITPWCEGRPFGPSDVTHGDIGIYSATEYAMTIETDVEGQFAHGVFTINELQEAGFTFTPPFSAQEGATYVCSIGQKTYAWQRVNVQPETDITGKQNVIDASHMLSSDLVDDTNNTHLFVSANEKQTWSGKQDEISDLQDIIDNASKGATATQPSDVTSMIKSSVISANLAPSTSTEGYLGQILVDIDTGTGYMCVGVDTETPEYTWKQITV